ncbi:FxsA family protein [Bacillus massiliglaciei]|uniref:FxsA family protein n=1 Tax=Bacillus massiliglaciei TaxID=1816693 RepID=UPI000DA610AC|nr:FxsA family protein [Bacillus massiliglaciei]
MKYLLFLIIAVPALEISVLLWSGSLIGVGPTLLLILITAAAGAFLARKQGLSTLQKAREQIRYGGVPGNEILDGICILIGGAFLLLPGFVSDILGLILLLPPTRAMLKPVIIRRIMNRINKGKITVINHK